MLRNMNQSSAGDRICGTTHTGVLASAIPTGFHLPSLLENDIDAGDPAGCEYRVQILDWPVGATLQVAEDGSYIFTGPDGFYAGGQRIFKNGIAQTPDTTYSISIGNIVSAGLEVAYQVKAPVSRDLACSYSVAQQESAVVADLAVSYAVAHTISTDFAAAYTMRNLVDSDLVAAYQALGQVSADLVCGAETMTLGQSKTPRMFRIAGEERFWRVPA